MSELQIFHLLGCVAAGITVGWFLGRWYDNRDLARLNAMEPPGIRRYATRLSDERRVVGAGIGGVVGVVLHLIYNWFAT